MQQWTPHVGETIPLVGSLHARVLGMDRDDVTLGFVDTNGNPSVITSMASRQRARRHRAWVRFRATGETGHMMVVRSGAGQRIELDERHDLLVDLKNGAPVRLTLVVAPQTDKRHRMNDKTVDGHRR